MTVPSDAEIVGLMAKLYAPSSGDFDRVEDPGGDDGVCWGVKEYADVSVLVFRGSMCKEDWFRDALAEMSTKRFSDVFGLGPLPLGFSLGLDVAMAAWLPLCKKPLVLAGHSLGAARASESAGLALAKYVNVARIVLCGCPRPGTGTLVERLAGIDIRSYRNLSDPVCDVPTNPPWTHVRTFTALAQAPASGDISIFRDHHIELYQAGVSALEASKT